MSFGDGRDGFTWQSDYIPQAPSLDLRSLTSRIATYDSGRFCFSAECQQLMLWLIFRTIGDTYLTLGGSYSCQMVS